MNAPDPIHWPVPTEFPLLRPGEIHLWSAWLGTDEVTAPVPVEGLGADEVARANAFHFPLDRQRYIAARRNLRQLLGRYLGREPAELAFSYGRFGKPKLAQPADPLRLAQGELSFNQSHCDSLWLVAVAWNQPLGVDVERVRDLSDLELLEDRLFSAAELARQRARPPEERRLAFFRRWTEQEAAVKLRGLGFDPSAPGLPPARSDALQPTAGSVGTLAHGGTATQIQHFQWSAELVQRPASLSANAA
jgi:4'-phosphopantetheinyl transferase